MKKILSYIMILSLFLTLVSCIRDDRVSVDGHKIYKIGMVTDVGGINDQSFNQISWKGMQEVAKRNSYVKVNFLESKSDADYYSNIELFVDNDYDLIVCVGYNLADALEEVATENPNAKFAIVDDNSVNLPNVANIMFAQEQAAYLVGVVAAMMTETDTVGYVQGQISESLNCFGVGYISGIKSINKDINILQYNANSFSDSSIGSSAATAMITKNADVIFHAAGSTGAGVISACQENKIYAIGVDCDQAYLAPDTVITSAMKNVDVAVIEVCENFLKGTFKAGLNYYDLNNNGVDIAPTRNLLPDSVIEKVNQAKDDIKSGKIIVPKNASEEPDFTLAKK